MLVLTEMLQDWVHFHLLLEGESLLICNRERESEKREKQLDFNSGCCFVYLYIHEHWEIVSNGDLIIYSLAVFALSIRIYLERVRSLISCGTKDSVIPISWLLTGNQGRNGFHSMLSSFRLLFYFFKSLTFDIIWYK